jgi:hypothetical protein
MVAQVEPRVEIDDRIKADPALADAVAKALAYFATVETTVPLPAAIRWRVPALDPTAVELQMSDTTDFSDAVVSRLFRRADIEDPYARDVGMLRAYGQVLRLRSEKSMLRINQLIRNIDFDALERATSSEPALEGKE